MAWPFCAYTILQSEPLIVPDALADERFCDNPLVTGAPFIRSYFGFPLVVGGEAVGALCVIDDRARELSADTLERLRRLAQGTSAWLTDRLVMRGALEQARDELRHIAFHDGVTGLPNRMVFQDRLKQGALHCDQSSESLAVVLIDLDGLKWLNNASGDALADQALCEVAARLSTLAGPSNTVARLHGDQFLVMLEGPQGAQWIVQRLERIVQMLRPPIEVGGKRASLIVSMGVAVYPGDGPADRLVAHADTAMMSAKQSGGDAYRFFELRMNIEAQARVSLLNDLRGAVERAELELHYQPKIHASSGQVTGVEALLRWNRPSCGLVSPAVFIPLAEDSGLIQAIGGWVIEEACRQMKVWRDAGINMRVAINLSVHQLRRSEIAEDVRIALQRAGIAPELLTCEITESVAMDGATGALAVFEKFKAVGVRLSIDDFGTGYSSLSYLRKMHVHQLKIDQSFVTDLGSSEDACAVVAAIIDLAHALRLEVVAEGVETTVQRDILLELGCDKFQGYLFARPMTADALFAWMSDQDSDSNEFRPSLFLDEEGSSL